METNIITKQENSDIFIHENLHSSENEWAVDTRTHMDESHDGERKLQATEWYHLSQI